MSCAKSRWGEELHIYALFFMVRWTEYPKSTWSAVSKFSWFSLGPNKLFQISSTVTISPVHFSYANTTKRDSTRLMSTWGHFWRVIKYLELCPWTILSENPTQKLKPWKIKIQNLQCPAAILQTCLLVIGVSDPDATFGPSYWCCWYDFESIWKNLEYESWN